jgi:hypothetical protein
MPLSILHAPTRAAVAAATSQTAQRDAMLAPWAGGGVRMRVLGTGGVLRQTQTLGAWTTGGTDPLEFSPGARSAWTHSSAGDIESVEFRLLDETPIFSIDAQAGAGAAAVDFVGVIKERCPVKVSGLVFTADDALPVAPEPPPEPFAVQTDANWTWFNKPEAARVGDLLYAGSVNSAGGIRVTQRHLDTAASNTFQLSAGFGSDDHNNASVIDCGGGRIAAFYAAHPDEFIRMRVQTTPGDNTAWSTQQNIEFGSGGLTDYYYPCPVILSQDPTQHFLFFRWRNGSGGFDLAYAVSSNFAAGPATFGSGIRLATNGPQRPYWSMFSNGVDRVDFLLSEGNPGEITGGVWHFYAKLDGSNVLRFYTTNGTEISGALPHSITTKCTKVNDTSDRKHWVWDVTTGTDGQPWALFVRFAANAGTDHRYHFARWNGSAWTHAEFTAAGGFLYSGEPFYSQGMHFSRVSPTRIYAGVPVSSVQQISTWAVGSGTSVSKVRDVTTGDAGTRARPVSPYNADSRCEALWWEGTYTSYTSYSTDVKGIAA